MVDRRREDNPQWAWKERDGLRLGSPTFMIDPYVVTLTTRVGGYSRPPYRGLNLGLHAGDDPETVRKNRGRLCAVLGIGGRVATAEQVHGTRVARVEEPGVSPRSDALVTGATDLHLVISTADCFPVLLGEPLAGLTAAVHAGWRGLAAGVIESTFAALEELGGRSDQVRAWVGPGIGSCCYQVGPEVAERFPEDLRRREPDGSLRLDLREAVHRRLVALGVWPRNIRLSSHCTACRTDLFFSHRAEGGTTGRLWSLIGRPSDPPQPIFEMPHPNPER
jgi:YfiH family protein